MSFWENIKNLKNEINRVEGTVYSGHQSLLEVYERNAKLEAEIAERTKELDTANKQMVTLQHIWDMMNSSKPLSSVLSAVVKNLQGELGYLHSCIAKIQTDENGNENYQLIAYSGSLFENVFLKLFNNDLYGLKMSIPKLVDITNAVLGKSIYVSKDILKLFEEMLPDLSNTIAIDSVQKTNAKSYIFIPLTQKNTDFGALIVFSSREDVSENELNFLKLFAKQIELAITIADLFQAVKEQAITDGMTGLYNRRYFEEYIQKEALRSERQHQPFTVVGLDLDHLKQINDVYGHNYGDIAIKSISDVLKSCCRSIDVPARMGGEEFNIILPGVDSEGGMVMAERIRKSIEDLKLEKIEHITASVGVGTYGDQSDNIEELLELVDHAMYESKRNGRNRVTLAKPTSETSWQEVAIDAFIDILSKHRIPIDSRTSRLLNKKLNEMNVNNDMLYQVSDTLISTYNPDHRKGATKKKLQLANMLAKRFELSKESMNKLKVAVLLYDIGNTMLPKEILNKKEPLSDDDITSIRQHPVLAAREILQPISNIIDIIPIIEKHHENWNGSGYPNKLSGDSIPIESQIILIVDSYFALLERRPYRDAMSKEDAIKIIMQDSECKWSEKLANEFESIVKEDMN